MPTTAIVIGGSLAGMCAARVLSDFVDAVTIIERDVYPAAHDFRPGVPQARHVHNLLAGGLREFEGFFPGFERRLLECGAVPVETGWDVANLTPSGWSARSHTGLWQLYASRPLIESTVRELCRDRHNVTFLEGTEVTGLRVSREDPGYCTGVEILRRDDGKADTLDAHLVVDASGAHSRAADWLEQLQLQAPEEEIVDGFNGYSSRWFTLKRGQAWPPEWWWKVVFLRMATADHPYIVVIFPLENQRWLLSDIGVNKQYPPRREDELAAALAKLASPVIHEMVERMEPISPIYSSRATRNRWRHYERWRRPLGRFIALADAACSYNPRFGQGMSAAAISVKIFQDCLTKYGVGDPRLPNRFFSAQAHFQKTPLLYAAADDLRFPATVGNRPASVRLFTWYRLKAAACPDKRVGGRLSEVTQFVRPIQSLFAPQIVSRVVVAALRRQGQQTSSHGIRQMPPGVQ
ncbi:MAG TPA: FAD-dependent monooxygenase [Stellaceae bacterium]|nr:FAD-dependent monooxygenase [Stellaceae bacterium]